MSDNADAKDTETKEVTAESNEAPVQETQSTPAAEASDEQQEETPAATPTVAADDQPYTPTDVFAWANNLYQYKDQLQIELFMINKNNVMYRAKLTEELGKQLQPLFITNILDYILNGAAEGLVVRGFEDAEAENNVLQRTAWRNVDKLVEVMHWIRTQEHEIQQFVEAEHDLKRIKAVMARCSHPAMAEPFYVIKALPRAQMMKGEGSWMVSGKLFMPFEDAVALRIPADNQLLVVGDDLFVFSQPKLASLFGYDAKKNSIAEKKVAEIQEKYKLVFAEGEDMNSMVKGNKQLINKLQKLELTESLSQEEIVDHSEEMDVSMLTDERGAIIIENPKDLIRFVNLVNDDYIESNLTGIRYEVKSKRPLKPSSDNEEI
ncbi:MAG TPA: Kiwa anti-phage protein KwaB-like domain-containing protein [Candidatus Saccharimonadales bacterium]|nr:Kiwa anti-phage protein KwaB-like domain-containing protein [Candidatus Saccharimonadales bacterium]